jgi:hypothetical protein
MGRRKRRGCARFRPCSRCPRYPALTLHLDRETLRWHYALGGNLQEASYQIANRISCHSRKNEATFGHSMSPIGKLMDLLYVFSTSLSFSTTNCPCQRVLGLYPSAIGCIVWRAAQESLLVGSWVEDRKIGSGVLDVGPLWRETAQ